MRYSRLACLSLGLFLLFTVFLLSQDKNQETTEEIQTPPGLIRIDLLTRDQRTLNPSKRNIFIPNSASRQDREEIEDQIVPQQVVPSLLENMEAERLEALRIGIRYIGYVKTELKITALILFEGEALAVDVGEEIAEKVSISKITLENITVIGPDNEPQTFPLEGETL